MKPEFDDLEEKREDEEFERDYFSRQDYRLVQFILQNEEVSEELKNFLIKYFWAFRDREMALTNFAEIDVQRERLMFKDAVLSFLMSKPQYKYTFEDQVLITNLEAIILAKLKRSTGGNQRERFILGSQIQQRLGEVEQAPSGGLIQKVGKFLGMR